MIRLILGLGNPGKEYEGTRHNSGRDAAMYFAKKLDFDDFETDKKSNALVSSNKIGKSSIIVALPETFMNKSGSAAVKLFRTKKENPDLVVLHDDLDIELGRFKISYGKNSGGHKGVESVMRGLKTKNFVRIRIGISPKKKPNHKDMLNFIVGKFKPAEQEIIKKVFKKISEALECMATDSLDKAMSEFNG
ncbi:MAG: Peptidyl-tRNA hydrolase [Candidatus Giovannonibacteria bacterium GW2011_GWA2_44_13b]|uniref:Peptidyl-tRNA hydrolase n=2 Tax=Candidatus Giovannoniibacteriota TaxID=1752738 RepID=A0A0G1H3B7_9BACT|nr:MAG: Peptidyl-tRNA hydrolase [Candidatus Giovannonibacteria bacterium GW2011_GWA2_44_13b]OGF83111.1 MAG: hypothetical protein A2924_04000 [Candidatus Giovannonibacteria bacterium RIFCSPLOWO2_01_FULL_44_16]